MKNYNHRLYLLLFLPVLFFSRGTDLDTWKLVKEKGPIKVYTRKSNDSEIKELRITTTMKASVNDFMGALGDANSYKVWVYNCLSSKLLQRVSDLELYYQVKTDFPFPLSDRDLVVHTKQHFDDAGNFYSNSIATPEKKPVEEGVVRIHIFESHWKVSSQGDGRIFVDYNSKVDPAGHIPLWVVNLGLVVGPLNTMESLTKFVEKRTLKH